MKLAIARSPYAFGGIFRRFRELTSYCRNKHEVIGLMPLAHSDGTIEEPAKTFTYAATHLLPALMHADNIAEILPCVAPLTDLVYADLARERPERVLAVDTDVKGLVIVAACHKAGLPVTTFVASVHTLVDKYSGQSNKCYTAAVERYCLEESDSLIFPSRMAAQICSSQYPAMASHTVIYNGIADPFFDVHTSSAPTHRIGAVMRSTGIKNPHMLARVAHELKVRGIGLDLITDPTLVKSRSLFSDAPVNFLPQTLDTELLAVFFAGCDAILCPSRFEASGNVPMEAIATGTPAIITDQMGVAEVFHDLGLSELIVPVDDINATMMRLLSSKRIEPRVRNILKDEFAWPAVCQRIIDFL